MDKANSVVIINKNNYKTKIKDILSNSIKFEKLEFDENKQLNFLHNSAKKLTKISVKRYIKKSVSLKKQNYSIYPTGSKPGILYGSTKIHKPIIHNCSSF